MFPARGKSRGAARQLATAKGPAHAREAAGPEAAERARLGRERKAQAPKTLFLPKRIFETYVTRT